jgi:hypothetical protein
MLTEQDIQARDALEAAIRDAGIENRFWAIRGIAIQSYALLEQSLGDLFAGLNDINPIVAGITFFRITSTRARNTILDKFFRNKYHSQYHLFRNSLFHHLPDLDNRRNQIVHWNAVNMITREDDGSTIGNLTLRAPFLWAPSATGEQIDTDTLLAFIDKSMFFASIIRMFTSIAIHRQHALGFPADFHDAWRDIFQQPITYPPQADHPSVRFFRGRGILPSP